MANPPVPPPVFNKKGKLLAPPNTKRAVDFSVLDSEGRDEGDAAAAAALLRGEELPPQEAHGEELQEARGEELQDAEAEVPEHAPPVRGAAGALVFAVRHVLALAPPFRTRGVQVGGVALIVLIGVGVVLERGGFVLSSTAAATGATAVLDILGLRDATLDLAGLALAASAALQAALSPHVRDPPRAQTPDDSRLGLGALAWDVVRAFPLLFAATAAVRGALRHPRLRAPLVQPRGAAYRDLISDAHLGPLAWARAGTRFIVLLLTSAAAVRAALVLAGLRRDRLAAAHAAELLLLLLATAAAVLGAGIP